MAENLELFPGNPLLALGSVKEVVLVEGGQLRLMQMLDPAAAEEWKSQLIERAELRERTILMFGREVLQPRLVDWAGDVPYTYSGKTLRPRSFSEPLEALRVWTEQLSGYQFNHALLNLYRNGTDSMGYHADDEPELGENPVIASWSFGATRKFHIRSRKKGGQRKDLVLESGSLLLMEGAMQHHYVHGLPKDRMCNAPRLNVTFRLVHTKSK